MYNSSRILKIRNIENNLEFTFESDDDVTIIGITPLAKIK